MTKRINNFKLMKETEDLKTKFLKTGKWLEGYEQGKAQALKQVMEIIDKIDIDGVYVNWEGLKGELEKLK